MSESVIEAHPTPLMAAVEDNLLGHVAFVQRRLPGMRVDQRDELTIVDSGLASDTFNKILAARLPEDGADARIDEALAYVRGTGRAFTWWIGPCSRPVDLEARLCRRGLAPEEYELGMTIDLEAAAGDVSVPAGARIANVTTAAELDDFAGVLAHLTDPADEDVVRFFQSASAALLEPDCPMRLFVAYADGEPAAVSELFLGGGVAGVHMVGTAERFRRRGLGMALTWKALDEGRRRDMRVGALQASAQGQPLYEKLGFEPCGRFVEYAVSG